MNPQAPLRFSNTITRRRTESAHFEEPVRSVGTKAFYFFAAPVRAARVGALTFALQRE